MRSGKAVSIMACLAFVALATPVAATPTDPEAEKAIIAQTINDCIGWFKNKDFDRLFEVFADDPDLFLLHPTSNETLHGIEAFRAFSAIWRDPANKYVSHDVRDLRIHLHPSHEVAWFSATLDDCGEYGGRVGCWRDTRWTGVLEKRSGRWVAMQMHFSFAADKVLEAQKKREEAQKREPSGDAAKQP